MNTKPFDLEAAKRGARVVTRSQKPVRIICYDMCGKTYTSGRVRSILALVKSHGTKEELVLDCFEDGMYSDGGRKSQHDLVMAVDEDGNYIYDRHPTIKDYVERIRYMASNISAYIEKEKMGVDVILGVITLLIAGLIKMTAESDHPVTMSALTNLVESLLKEKEDETV